MLSSPPSHLFGVYKELPVPVTPIHLLILSKFSVKKGFNLFSTHSDQTIWLPQLGFVGLELPLLLIVDSVTLICSTKVITTPTGVVVAEFLNLLDKLCSSSNTSSFENDFFLLITELM